jgi:5-methylcytosine-specific restriction endonuclease McrA
LKKLGEGIQVSKMNEKRCLLLNGDGRPLEIVSWQKMVCLLLKNAVDPCDEILMIVCSPTTQVEVPTVGFLRTYVKRDRFNLRLSKKNIFYRDNGRCQYCRTKLTLSEMTLDHVVPKSHFEKGECSSYWENLVTCCVECNRRKKDKTPEQARMHLLSEPKKPKYIPSMVLKRNEVWEKYF